MIPPGDLQVEILVNEKPVTVQLRAWEPVSYAAKRQGLFAVDKELEEALQEALKPTSLKLPITNERALQIQSHWQNRYQKTWRKFQQEDKAQPVYLWKLLRTDSGIFDSVMSFLSKSARDIDTLVQQHQKRILEYKNQPADKRELLLVTLRGELDTMHATQRSKFDAWLQRVQVAQQKGTSYEHPDHLEETIEKVPQFERSVKDPNVKSLLDMGFQEHQAVFALQQTNSNMELAVQLLLENPEAVQRSDVQVSATGQNKEPQAVEVPQNRPWTPQAFIGDQSATLKKLGSWIDKAKTRMEQAIVVPQALENSPQQLQSESFTFTLGTHIQHTQTMRLVVQQQSQTFRHPADLAERDGLRAQTFATMFTQSKLVAAVNLVSVGTATYTTFNRACNYETEFVFDGIPPIIVQDEGDFMITRHSNLPLISVVFHLAIEDNLPVIIQGLKNIFGVANKYGVHELVIPLLLLSDNKQVLLQSDEQLKRAETVLKCIRSCWMELLSSRNDADGLEVVQILVPVQSQHLFGDITNQVRSIFKVV